MSRIDKKELFKIGIVAIVGILALVLIIFWLKGHKIYNYAQFTFYFKSINGLEEGNALRWNGLKIGVVDSITAVKSNFAQAPFPSKLLLELGKRNLKHAQAMLNTNNLEDLLNAQEVINKAQMEIALASASDNQKSIIAGEYVAVTVVVTQPEIPIGPLNQVSIVPSGVIGEQYVEISSIKLDDEFLSKYRYTKPRFIVIEPIRLDNLIKVNVESAVATTNLVNRLNALLGDEDAENMKKMIDSLATIASDTEFRQNVKESAENINKLTKNFKIWKLF
jgi:ABC-type transporter Mla subunit MlaD